MATHHITLETNEVQQVLNILGTRPFNEVAPLIQKLAGQLQAPAPPTNGDANKLEQAS